MKKAILLFLFVLLAGMIYSQGWMKYLPSGRDNNALTFYDYQDAFKKWCKELKIDNTGYYTMNGEKRKAYGWKQFKRWEIEMRGWFDLKTGIFFKADLIKELEEYRLKYPESSRNHDGEWVNLGYSNPLGGYLGVGRLNTIEFHPDDPDIFWVGAPTGGLWVTEDHGATWTPKTDQIPKIQVSAIAVPSDFSSSNTIYIGTGDRDTWSRRGNGILKSTDGGNTWSSTGLTTDVIEFYVGGIKIHPDSNNSIYAITSAGLYKSIDSGENWEMLKVCKGIDMEFNPLNPEIIYISTRIDDNSNHTRIYRTLDGGATWQTVLSRIGSRTELAVSPDEPTWVYAIVSDLNRGLQAIYRSTDNGGLFSLIFSGIPLTNNILSIDCVPSDEGGQGEYDLCLAANPTNAEEVYVGGINTWKSVDGGFTWEICNVWTGTCGGIVQEVHADHHWLEFQYNTETLFDCNDGGIYFTEDAGESWTDISAGLTINQIYRISGSQQTSNEIIMGLQDNGNALWTGGYNIGWRDGDGCECQINPLDDDIQYRCSNSGFPLYTFDHWANAAVFEVENDSGGWFKPFRFFPDNPANMLYALTNVWITYDHGQNFELFFNPSDSSIIHELEIAPSDPQVVFVCNEDNLYKTNDGGQDWENLTSYLPFIPFYLFRIEIKQDDQDVIWITNVEWGGNNSVYMSEDGGYTWTNISYGLPDIPFYDIIQNDLNTSMVELYASSISGIYMKLGEQPWISFNGGLPNVPVYDIDIYYAGANTKLRAGTFGRGFWETPVFSISTDAPGIWTGTVSKSWFDPQNWQYVSVPNQFSDVTVPAGCSHYPEIHSFTQCNKLTIEDGGEFTLSESMFQVNDSLIVNGELLFNGNAADLVVLGNVVINPTAQITISDNNMEIYTYRDWWVKAGSFIILTKGTVIFKGSQNSKITIDASLYAFNNITIDKDPGKIVYYSLNSLQNLITGGTFTILTGNTYRHNANKDFVIITKFVNNGTYLFLDGTFKYAGESMSLSSNTSSHFYHFDLNNAACNFTLSNNIEVRGDMHIDAGTLLPQGNTIDLHGSWYNSPSGGEFEEATSRVVFSGTANQAIYNHENFNILEIDKASDTLIIDGVNVICNHYDWTDGALKVGIGSFTANDLTDNGIFGDYTLINGFIDLYNDDYIDLNGFLNISGGTFNVHGGSRASYWPYSANAGLTMSGGVLDFKDQGIYLNDVGLSFTDIITGGVIRTSASFGGPRHDFNPAGGYIELYGDHMAGLSHGTGSSFYEVRVHKGTAANEAGQTLKSLSRDAVLPTYAKKTTGRVKDDGTIYPGGPRSTKVTVFSILDIDRDVDIVSGELDISNYVVSLERDLIISGMLTMTDPAGELHVGRDVQWNNSATENITAGNIFFSRDWLFGNSTQQHLGGTNVATADGDNIQNISFTGNKTGFRNLVIAKSASYAVINQSPIDTLNIFGYLHVNTGNTFNITGNARLKVDSLLLVESGATFDLNSNSYGIAGSKLQLDGTMHLQSNPKMFVKKTFIQNATGHLIIDYGSFIIDAPYSGTLHGFGGITDLNGGNFEITNDGIQLGVGAVYNFNGGNMRIGWNFKAIFAGSFQPALGTVELIGNRGAQIEIQNGNYFHNLLINKGSTYTVNAMDPVIVDNDLTITSGTYSSTTNTNKLTINNDLIIGSSGKLNPADGEVEIAGNWTNNHGTAGFTEGTSTLTFNGNKNSTLNNTETFYRLIINKPHATDKNLYLTANLSLTTESNLQIVDGTLQLGNFTDLTVMGTLSISAGAGLNANPGTSSALAIEIQRSWSNSNSNYNSDVGFNPGHSTVTFSGNLYQAYSVTSGGGPFYNLVINKSGNVFNSKTGMTVLHDVNFAAGDLIAENPNLIYEIKRDFDISASANWLDSTAVIKFTGPSVQTYTCLNATIPKFKDFILEMQSATVYTTLYSDLKCKGEITVNEGDLRLHGYTMDCGTGLSIYPGGKLSGYYASVIRMGNNAQVNVAGGELILFGNDPDSALLTHISSGYYTFSVNSGGKLSAGNAIFEYMGTDGINITTTGLIDPASSLFGCTFRKGISGGKLLTVNNTQKLTVQNAYFPANTWSGAYNVSKPDALGSLTFINESGGFAGPAYENDPNNIIFWSLSGRWTGTVSHNWHTAGNWFYNSVPNTSVVVYIPASTPFSPWIQATASCKSLTLEQSAYLKLDANDLTISTYADIYGEMHLDTNIIFTLDSLIFRAGSSVTADTRAYVKIRGGLFVEPGADVKLNQGTMYFIDAKNSSMTCQADTTWVNDLINQKPAGFALTYVNGSTGILVVQGNFTNNTDALLKIDSPEEIIFKTRFRNYGGYIKANDGTITLTGDPYYSLRTNDNSYFNNLTIRTTTHLKLDNNYNDSLVVNGTLKIEINPLGSSGLETNANTSLAAMPIIVGSNWINTAGTAAFVHGNGRVEFNSETGNQDVMGWTNFYNVEEKTQSDFKLRFYNYNYVLNNLTIFNRTAVYDTLMVGGLVDLSRSGAYFYMEDDGYVETESLDQGGHFVGNSGYFMAYDLADADLNGDWKIYGASVMLYQDPSSSLDLNGTFDISAGEFYVIGNGGSLNSNWPSPAGSASLTMSGGIFGFEDLGIFIFSNNFSENITGGTIVTAGNFTSDEGINCFNPAGGTVELKGNTNTIVNLYGANCWFNNLKISKNTGKQVTVNDALRIKGNLDVATGKLLTNGEVVQVGP
jgi:photosystem II stability/assembly factor-like uncharacterized protein